MKRSSIFYQLAAGFVSIFLLFVWFRSGSAQNTAATAAATVTKVADSRPTLEDIEEKINAYKDADEKISVSQKPPYSLDFYDGLLAGLAEWTERSQNYDENLKCLI